MLNDSSLSLRESGVRFQLAQSEFRKLEAYATKNSQPPRESSVRSLRYLNAQVDNAMNRSFSMRISIAFFVWYLE